MRQTIAPAGASMSRKTTKATTHMKMASQTAFLIMVLPFWA